tara:strand:- start:8231 stop:9166 length:936 start_codon:yes stop_codon:yes gene_type:complete
MLKNKIRDFLNEDYWSVGLIEDSIYNVALKKNEKKIIWLNLAKKNEFAADPFIYQKKNDDNILYIFYELFSFEKLKGSLAYAKYDIKNKEILENKIIIDEKFHLSYPFILENKNKLYIVPECSESNNIYIYECKNFPLVWEKKILIRGFSGIDNSILKHNDKWWLFSTNKEEGQHSHLHIFYADKLMGEWKNHKKNPVKIDISSTRSAGKFISFEGKLFRPSMDNSKSYGEKIKINLIKNLTEEKFNEITIREISPKKKSKYPNKLHTINGNDLITIIDSAKLIPLYKNYIIFKSKINRIRIKIKNVFKYS